MKKKIITLFLAVVFILCNATVAFATEPTYNYKTGTEAVAAIDNTGVVIVDVRTKANYDKGHLKGSISYPLFVGSDTDDTLKSNFTQYVKDNITDFEGKDIYILCNSGSRGAVAGTEALKNALIPESKIFTIEGGAKGTDSDKSVPNAFVIDYNFVSGTDAVAAIDNTGVVIVDVRTKANYDKGHLKGSISIPLFNADGVTNGSDDLAKAFTDYVNNNAATFKDKDIYIVCNSGARGAQAATKLLLDANYSLADIFTIEGGAKGTDSDKSVPNAFVIDYNFVSGTEAVAAIGNTGVVIVDVRTTENYNKGHLKGSISIPLFNANGVTNGSDDLAKAFTDYVNNNAATFKDKDIYIVCNSGARGAQAATKLLLDANYSLADIFTIEGGAKGTDTDKSVPNALTYVSADQAISVIDNKDYVIIDVRTTENYAKGHLKGSVSVPLFNANGVTNGSDDLAKAFTNYVNANKAALDGKTIYILCNSGARGAQNATTLLAAAGIKDNVFTIEGGATNASIQAKFVVETPKTGDATSTMMYIMLMVVALGAVVVINKKRVVK